ncbi:MAG: hypothetical protein NTW29_01545 [Bacteroidetes bacterium]|nr:hypothetical protein [Bacteroidota bacterium]
MKKLLFISGIIFILYACKNKSGDGKPTGKPEAITDSTLVTDSTWGPITATDDITALQKHFGAENVKDERVCGPECVDSIDITFIYPETSRQIRIHWQDSAYHKKIGFIEAWDSASPYHTAAGIRCGSTLKELLSLNGSKITFTGFGWDYGGFIQGYGNGKLEKSNIGFRLDSGEWDSKWSDADSLMGDVTLDTDVPAVKRSLDRIKVYYLSLSFYPDEH